MKLECSLLQCLLPVPILSQLYPVHTPTFHFLTNHLNIILPSTPEYLKWYLPSGLPIKTQYTPLLSPIRATCLAHLILLDFITRTILGEDYRSLSSSLCSFLHYPHLFPLMAKYSPQHPTLRYPRLTFLHQIQSIHNLVNKLETTGSLMGKKLARKRTVLTEEKLDTISAQLETSPRKSLK